MAKTKEFKLELSEQVKEKISKSQGVIASEFQGITANEIADLRRSLKTAGCEMTVTNNRVYKKAIEGGDAGDLAPLLEGPVFLTYLYGDVANGAKALIEFGKSNDKLKIKGGILQGKPLAQNDVKALASLPSKEVLLAKIIGSMVSPHRGLLSVLNGVSPALGQLHDKG